MASASSAGGSSDASGPRLSPGDEAKQISAVWKEKLGKDETWYILDFRWFQSWCQYTGFNSKGQTLEARLAALNLNADASMRPGPINNASLHLDPPQDMELKRGLVEDSDYALIPQEAYELLQKWYGGGPHFDRNVTVVGLRQETRVDFYPLFWKFMWINDNSDPDESKAIYRRCNKSDTVSALLATFQKEASGGDAKSSEEKTPLVDVRMWMERQKIVEDTDEKKVETAVKADAPPPKKKWQIVPEDMMQQTLEATLFPTGTVFLLEKKDDAGKWVRSPYKENFRDYEIGDLVDAEDTSHQWYQSIVENIDNEKQMVFIHFINWERRWDEWMPFDSPRIARLASHPNTDKPYQRNRTFGGAFSSYGSSEAGTPVQSGAVGLRNLSNTCYMNSTLQCLSNSPQLTDYFLQDHHIPEINRENVLGKKGRFAEEFAALLKEMWQNKFRVVAPSKFSSTLREFAPQFTLGLQHDSSELLAFLLDGLHEDLNRVRSKPATQPVESKGRPDEEVAAEAWEVHQKRNRSMVVDYMQGQLKSTVVCPECPRVSVTFDPFMMLSVPLPEVFDKRQKCTFVFRDYQNKGTLVVEPTVAKTARITNLKEAVSAIVGVPASHMVAAELWYEKLHRFLNDDEGVSDIGARDDILIYECPELATMPAHKAFYVQLLNFNQHMQLGRGDMPLVIAVDSDAEIKTSEIKRKVKAVADPRIRADFSGQSAYDIMLPTNQYETYSVMSEDDVAVDIVVKNRYPGLSFYRQPTVKIALRWTPGAYDDRFCLERKQHESVGAAMAALTHKVIALEDCFLEFARPERLGADDTWYCSDCKKHQQACKKFDMWRLPNILIVHLKRFSYNRLSRDKITSYVDFPTEGLDVKQFCANPNEPNTLYDLYAVSNHMGAADYGHYHAYVKNLVDNKWYWMDDSVVTPIDESQVKTPAAYVLFYRRRGIANAVSSPPPASS